MSVRTKKDLLDEAAIIKDELTVGKNTATRVGTMLEHIIDFIEEGDNSSSQNLGNDIDLSNYYLKSQTYNKGEVDDKFSKLKGLRIGGSGSPVISIIGTSLGQVIDIPVGGGPTSGISKALADTYYISKQGADTADGKITFNSGIDVNGTENIEGNLNVKIDTDQPAGTTGNIVAEGTITGATLHGGNVYSDTNIIATNGITAQTGNITATLGDISAGRDVSASRNINANSNITAGGTITANGNITTSGNLGGNTLSVETDGIIKRNLTVLGTLNGNEANFNKVTTDYLTVTKAAHFFSLVIDELRALKGALLITCGQCTADFVEPIVDGANTVAWRVYFRADDGAASNKKTIHQSFISGDLAICQTFDNVLAGTSSNVSTTYYWRLVEEVSNLVTTRSLLTNLPIDSDENEYHWIVLSNRTIDGTLRYDGEGIPKQGDDIILLGYNPDWVATGVTPLEAASNDLASRQSAIIISAYEAPDQGYLGDLTAVPPIAAIPALVPPSLAFYEGIESFNLALYRTTYMDATGNYFKGTFISEDSSSSLQGNNLEAYTIITSTPLVVKDSSTFNPSTITIKILKNLGDGSSVLMLNWEDLASGLALTVNGTSFTGSSGSMTYTIPSASTDASFTFALTKNAVPKAEASVKVIDVNVTNGVQGGYTEFAYQKRAISAGTPQLPNNGAIMSANLSVGDWGSTVPTLSADYYIWLATRNITFPNGTILLGNWEGPIRITGEVGEDGTNYEFIYYRCNTLVDWADNANSTINPATWDTSSTTAGKGSKIFLDDDYLGPSSSPWTDNPTGVTNTFLYEYVSVRKKNNGTWGNFSGPALWAKWGEKGQDGDGVKYIFARISENSAYLGTSPVFMIGNNNDIEGYYDTLPLDSPGYLTATTSNILWYDDPIPTAEGLNVYCSMSKTSEVVNIGGVQTKVWKNWSTPSKWLSYAAGGEQWILVPTKEIFEVLAEKENVQTGVTGKVYLGLEYQIAHVDNGVIEYLTDLTDYTVTVKSNNSLGNNLINSSTTDFYQVVTSNDNRIIQVKVPAGPPYYGNYLYFIKGATQLDSVDFYVWMKDANYSLYIPDSVTVTLKRGNEELNVRTVNLTFAVGHTFLMSEWILDSIYQGLTGNTGSGWSTGFSEIKQTWDEINLNVSNIERVVTGTEAPLNSNTEQFVFYRTNTNTIPTKPTGTVSTDTNTNKNWTLDRVVPSSSYPYVFISRRYRATTTSSWSDWSTPVLYRAYGSNSFYNSAQVQITADLILANVQETYVAKNDTQFKDSLVSLTSEAVISLVSDTYATVESVNLLVSRIEQEANNISLSVEEIRAAGNLLSDSWTNNEAIAGGNWSANIMCTRANTDGTAAPSEYRNATGAVNTSTNVSNALYTWDNNTDTEPLTTIFGNQNQFTDVMNPAPGVGPFNLSGNITLSHIINDIAFTYGQEDVLTLSIYIKRKTNKSLESLGTYGETQELNTFAFIISGLGRIDDYTGKTGTVDGLSGVTYSVPNDSLAEGYVQWTILDNEEHRLWVTFKLRDDVTTSKIGFRTHFNYVNDTKVVNGSTVDYVIAKQARWDLRHPKLEHSSKPTEWCEGESWMSRTGIDIESGKITLDANSVAVAKDLTIGGNTRVGGFVYNLQKEVTPSMVHICKNPYDYGAIDCKALSYAGADNASPYNTANIIFPECGSSLIFNSADLASGLPLATKLANAAIRKININLPFYHQYAKNQSTVASMGNMYGYCEDDYEGLPGYTALGDVPEITDGDTSSLMCTKFLVEQIHHGGDICRKYLGSTITIENNLHNTDECPIYIYGVKDLVFYSGDSDFTSGGYSYRELYYFDPWNRGTICWTLSDPYYDLTNTHWESLPTVLESKKIIDAVWGKFIQSSTDRVISNNITATVNRGYNGLQANVVALQVVDYSRFDQCFCVNDPYESDSFASITPYGRYELINSNHSLRLPFIVPEHWFCKLKLVYEEGWFVWKVEALGPINDND